MNKQIGAARTILETEKYNLLKARIQAELYHQVNEPSILMPEESALVKRIRTETVKWNKNNRTRTDAYLRFYKKNPEVHWALLAHMVSRNGGYHMTDLKGSTMEHLFQKEDRLHYFRFLERANSAIFADAYPQLLLFEHSKQNKIPLRKFLRIFHVSRFMYPIWEFFQSEQNSALLTIGLIINEQSMLEERILKRSRHRVLLERIDFQLQDFFGFTTVVFPYKERRNQLYSLTGVAVQRFAEPRMRILTGKILYGLLFHTKMFHGISSFSSRTQHTGSRADYWPRIFTVEKPLKDSGKKIYSPILEEAWSNQTVFPMASNDWFMKASNFEDLKDIPRAENWDITEKVLDNIRLIKLINDIKTLF